MITKCAACGKEIDILYPELWAYKKYGKIFYCTWKCFRKKENDIIGKITLEQKKKAVEIAISGGDPVEYLKECGAANAPAAWYQIKKKLAEADPEKAEELEKARHNKANREYKARQKVDMGMPKQLQLEPGENYEVSVGEAMGNMKDAADEFFGKCEEAGLMENRGPITKPMGYEGFTVRAVQGSFGRYSYSETRTAYIDYENNDGDELSMTLEQWRAFLDELHRAAQLLGVEL